ncbi:AAA family ATPase [Longimicrobium terrae]|uniref:AAA+ superfamily predicted ATPase n=1 Tax=Longimicrobium terrae TaxID=1639882 RepID=A0A841H6M5_9BACT|nr:AAA+ superfamily predicted ATPase [Longimicrobium terrae]MBB6073496.1 AAA+ superfamily predicted ATPase [Longimicrobium terrae]
MVDDRVQGLLYEQTPKQRFDDLILADTVRTACIELVEEQNRRDLLHSYGLDARNRILLTGPPGNGKTSVAEAFATELAVPLLTVRYEGLIGSYLGETSARLKLLFDHVRTQHCVLFFDEFDTVGKERGDQHETGEIKRVVSSLLLQIDRLPPYVIVVTATNHPELLDRAVWRRFQLRMNFPLPTRQQLELWFCKFAKDFPSPLGYAPRTLADKLHGLSFAEVEEFGSDILRRYVLALPAADTPSIIRELLVQWKARSIVYPSK